MVCFRFAVAIAAPERQREALDVGAGLQAIPDRRNERPSVRTLLKQSREIVSPIFGLASVIRDLSIGFKVDLRRREDNRFASQCREEMGVLLLHRPLREMDVE